LRWLVDPSDNHANYRQTLRLVPPESISIPMLHVLFRDLFPLVEAARRGLGAPSVDAPAHPAALVKWVQAVVHVLGPLDAAGVACMFPHTKLPFAALPGEPPAPTAAAISPASRLGVIPALDARSGIVPADMAVMRISSIEMLVPLIRCRVSAVAADTEALFEDARASLSSVSTSRSLKKELPQLGV
jgi:hypothetical protein